MLTRTIKCVQSRPFLFSDSSLIYLKRNCYKVVARPEVSKLKYPTHQHKIDPAIQISQRIKLSGPITVAEYMKQILTNSFSGYYMKKDVFGVSGDFITSPEISNMFGEMLGIWFVNEWQKLGMPTPFQIIEFGPGRGLLLSDILKVIHKAGINSEDYSIHLIEVSPTLQKMQADRLCLTHKFSESNIYYYEGESVQGSKIFWYKNIDNIPKQFSFIVAHEFFDVLPIHKMKKTENGWKEILIDLEPTKTLNIPKFKYVLSQQETAASKLYTPFANIYNLDHFEICPQALTLIKELATRVDEYGGISLIVDYGEETSKGDTFRAFKDHKQVNPLEHVGNADLTADVNFDLLKQAASNAKVFGPINQRDFLQNINAEIRLKVLSENISEEEQKRLNSSYKMLTDPDKMGNCFKFMALFPTITEDHYTKHPVIGF